MAADHDINRLSQALQVAITAEDERGKHVSTTQPTCDGSKIATTEKSRGLVAWCTAIMSPCFRAANSKIRSVTWALSYHAMWRDYAKQPHFQHDMSRHPDEFAAGWVQVNNGYEDYWVLAWLS